MSNNTHLHNPTNSNRLIKETSPYLLQHAFNPVDWYPWGDEAMQKAREENKPILISIGYAACHWCHVMERESFEDPDTAALMNREFINIKIDREERPDLDHIYMDAVQAMTGSGGWPLNVFLTPDARPFYGGTYFPPQRAYNRPSWKETLLGVSQAFREKREEIEAQAFNLTEHLTNASTFGIRKTDSGNIFDPANLEAIASGLLKTADRDWGGFGRAPKFPQTFSIQYLLRYHARTGDQESLDQALLSLDKMISGGIYDQIGGGFARYSTDTEWLVPHFEKMLYDNALLVGVLSEAYQLTGLARYREVIAETLDFVDREMTGPEGGFYAALDADSEGVEGKFYVWKPEEVHQILGEDAGLFCAYYDITEKGNWKEGGHGADPVNILRVRKEPGPFAGEQGVEHHELISVLERGRKKLLEARGKRVRPLTDDKIILGWNALMNTALCKAYAATGIERYRELAIRNMRFLLGHFKGVEGYLHTWKNGQARYPAFLDDLAFLTEAMIHLQEISADRTWLDKAKELTTLILAEYLEAGTGFFFYTREGQSDVILRKKEVYDGALPSGNAVMARNLQQLGILFDLPGWREQSREMLAGLGNILIRYPGSFGNWACFLHDLITGINEIAVVGEAFPELLKKVLEQYIPNRVLMGAAKEIAGYPLLHSRTVVSTTAVYLCRNYTCMLPVFSAKELMSLINRAKKQ